MNTTYLEPGNEIYEDTLEEKELLTDGGYLADEEDTTADTLDSFLAGVASTGLTLGPTAYASGMELGGTIATAAGASAAAKLLSDYSRNE